MSVVLSILIVVGTVLFGLLAGSAVDRGIVSFPARRRVGTIAWARYSRAADLGNGIYLYPFLAIAGAPHIERAVDPDQIRRLKATSERDLTVGGPRLAAAMIATNLVDEFHAFVHPIIIGGGNPWLPPDLRIPLELAGERRLGRVVPLHYRRS